MNPTQSPEFERLERSGHLIRALMRRNLDSYRCCCDAFKRACEQRDDMLARAAIRDARACIQETQRLIHHYQTALDARRSALNENEEVARSRPVGDGIVVPLFPPNQATPYVLPPVHATPSLDRVAVDGRRLLARLSTTNAAELRMVARNLRKLSHHTNVWARRTDSDVQDGCHVPDESQACVEDVTGNNARDDEAAPPIALRPVSR